MSSEKNVRNFIFELEYSIFEGRPAVIEDLLPRDPLPLSAASFPSRQRERRSNFRSDKVYVVSFEPMPGRLYFQKMQRRALDVGAC